MNTHKEQILKYLTNHVSITPWIAIEKFGCTKLATRIGELISLGYEIEKGWLEGKNRNGHKVKVRKYWLR